MYRAVYIAVGTTITALLLYNSYCVSNASSFDRSTAMFWRSTQAMLATASLASVAFSQQVLDLGTIEWTLTSPNFSYISVPGKVPSQVHLDLREAQASITSRSQSDLTKPVRSLEIHYML
jgi:hypothetical protein